MELLLDTDFIIKMGRLSLLTVFEDAMVAKGHPKPFRILSFEINKRLREAASDPAHSKFGSQKIWNMVNSFVQDCRAMDPPVDEDELIEMSEIRGMSAGERILVEYAMRTPDAVIVTCDKRFIEAMADPKAAKYRKLLQKRIHHMEHVIFEFGQGTGWPPIREAITNDPDCDTALHKMLHTRHSETDAVGYIYASMRVIVQSSVGTVPAPL